MKILGIKVGCPKRLFLHDWEKAAEKTFKHEFPDGRNGWIIKEKLVCLSCNKIWDMIKDEELRREYRSKKVQEILNVGINKGDDSR